MSPRTRVSRRSSEPAGRQGSKLPLVLAGVGGGVVVVVLVLVLVLSGGNKPPQSSGRQTSRADGATPSNHVDVAALTQDLSRGLVGAGNDVSALHQVYVKAKKAKLERIATRAAEQAVRTSRDTKWAEEALGRVEFAPADLRDIEDVLYPNDDGPILKKFLDQRWLTPDEEEQAKKAEKRFVEHCQRLKSDTHYRKEWALRFFVKKHPVFKDYKYITVEARPYLLFIQVPTDKSKLPALKAKAKRSAAIFTRLYHEFLKKFQKRFDLKPLEANDGSDVILKAWLFADRASFNKYQNTIQQPVSRGVGAYYNPSDQWMIIPEGDEAEKKSGFDTNKCFHEGTHQLIHCYSKRLIERETGKAMSWTDHRLMSQCHWFQEGIADFFGSVVKKGDSWDLWQFYPGRMKLWKMVRDHKAPEWELSQILRASNNADIMRLGKRYGPSLYYSQAWAFIYFLWNYKDGKYREKFLHYCGDEFHGNSSLARFLKLFGIDKDKIDGSYLDKEYHQYVKTLLARV